MNRTPARLLAAALRAAAALGLAALIGSCGSGAVSAPPTTPANLSVSPSSATAYAGLPSTFAIVGGTPPYIVVSSNQSAIAVADNVNSNTFTVVPGTVAVDTTVVLTVRDSAGAQANANVTVKPRTISNVVTITPSAAQPASCGTALCAGGDAEVNATLNQAGVLLAGRQVRFDVVSGDFAYITSLPGAPETTAVTAITTTDSNGSARIRIRATAGARAQTALLQITDVSGGFTQRTSFQIAPANSTALAALPATVEFVGLSTTSCATGPSADVIVFGGTPPYQVSQPSAFSVRPAVVLSNGDRFTVTAVGNCTEGQTISVVDGVGASTNVTVKNSVGPQNSSPFVVAPTTASFANCGDTASFALIGGTGNYIAATNSPYVTATIAGSTGTVQRPSPVPPAAPSPGPGAATTVQVTFSDGRSVVTVPINLIGNAAGASCP